MVHASSGEIILYGCKDGTGVTKQRVHYPVGTAANTMAQLLRKDLISRSAGKETGGMVHICIFPDLGFGQAFRVRALEQGRFSLKGFGTQPFIMRCGEGDLSSSSSGTADPLFQKGLRQSGPSLVPVL